MLENRCYLIKLWFHLWTPRIKCSKSVQKPCKPVSNFSYHPCVWGQNHIFRIPKNFIKENVNKVFKNCPKTMQTRVKLLIPWLCVGSKPHIPHTENFIKENTNKVFKKYPKTMQARVKLLIPWMCVGSKPYIPHTKKL